MKRSVSLSLSILLSAGAAIGQTSAPANDSSPVPSGAKINATFTKPVEAKKAKQGDEFTAKVTQDVVADGKVVITKGSKIIGHVTEAASSGEYKLGLSFDKVISKGKDIPLHAAIQAITTPPDGASFTTNQGLVGTAQNMDTAGGANRYNTGIVGSNNPAGPYILDPNASGALNMAGVKLVPAANGGTLLSTNKNIKFERDSLVLLVEQ